MHKQFNVELLPDGGKFIITLADGKKITGRFSMYALNRFCENQNLNYLELFVKVTSGMKISEYAGLVLCALEDYYREDYSQCGIEINGIKKRWTEELVMDLVLDPMGMGNEQAMSLFKHAAGRLFSIVDKQPVKKKK